MEDILDLLVFALIVTVIVFGLENMHQTKIIREKTVEIMSEVRFIEAKLAGISTQIENIQTPEETAAPDKSAYEIEREERMDLFDKRIQDMKEQLALQQKQNHIATQAEEFHPLVKNLPHDTVNTSPKYPDVEYAL